MEILYALGTVGAFSIINRLRGTSTWRKSLGLPGHSRWYAAILTFLVLGQMAGPILAALGTTAYLMWSLPPWGRWYDLGRYIEPDRKITKFEEIIEKLSRGDEHTALLLRHMVCLIPAAVLLSPYMILLAPTLVLITELSLRVRPVDGVAYAEYFHGAVWGVAFLMVLGG